MLLNCRTHGLRLRVSIWQDKERAIVKFVSHGNVNYVVQLSLLWMLIERKQWTILLWTRWFWCQACARNSLGIEVIVWMLHCLSWDRIIHERLSSHFCDVEL